MAALCGASALGRRVTVSPEQTDSSRAAVAGRLEMAHPFPPPSDRVPYPTERNRALSTFYRHSDCDGDSFVIRRHPLPARTGASTYADLIRHLSFGCRSKPLSALHDSFRLLRCVPLASLDWSSLDLLIRSLR